MSKTQRAPPCTPKQNPPKEKAASSQEYSSSQDKNDSSHNITVRGKRQRSDDSPGKQFKQQAMVNMESLKNEIMQMLTTWKAEQEATFSAWKCDQDAVLSSLVKDVSELKAQCLLIQNSNLEIEKGMEFISQSYEEIKNKVFVLEKGEKEYIMKIACLEKQLRDVRLQSRPATIELRNVPLKELEKPSDLVALVSNIGQAIQLQIKPTDLRDVYRLPGKPGDIRPIVAEFTSVSTRNDFLSTIRQFNKQRQTTDKLNTETIGMSGCKRSIYADEHLTPTLRKLLFDSRLFAKSRNYSCWHSNGKIFIRTEKDAKPINIKTEECLNFLGGKD